MHETQKIDRYTKFRLRNGVTSTLNSTDSPYYGNSWSVGMESQFRWCGKNIQSGLLNCL